jgi:lipoyl(octanoyl) transferase
MVVQDLGSADYRTAWALQEQAHAQVLAGGPERILLVEHPPVITFGRRPGIEHNILAPAADLAKLGVDIVPSDRGGDVTFHGPGQLVAYPIIRLADHRLSVGGYVHSLEDAIIDALTTLGVPAAKDACAVGVWTPPCADPAAPSAKIAAIGVRVRRGVTMHGLAINVTTNLTFFSLIVPCGLTGRPVTSLQQILGANTPPMASVKAALIDALHRRWHRSDTTQAPSLAPPAPLRRECPPASRPSSP